MPRRPEGRGSRVLYFVTGNKGKFVEAKALLSDLGFRLRQEDLELDEPQADSLEYVARKTGLSAFEILRRPLFLEDAGLFIDALKGFPGVYSSYVYSSIGIRGVLKLMEGKSERSARFRSCVAFISDSVHPRPRLFKGEVEGHISTSPKGEHGFGFDPIFIPSDFHTTFAQMDVSQKNELSHRSKAIRAMGSFLSRNPSVIG